MSARELLPPGYPLRCDGVTLRLDCLFAGDRSRGLVPAYQFVILGESGEEVGTISLRLEDTPPHRALRGAHRLCRPSRASGAPLRPARLPRPGPLRGRSEGLGHRHGRHRQHRLDPHHRAARVPLPRRVPRPRQRAPHQPGVPPQAALSLDAPAPAERRAGESRRIPRDQPRNCLGPPPLPRGGGKRPAFRLDAPRARRRVRERAHRRGGHRRWPHGTRRPSATCSARRRWRWLRSATWDRIRREDAVRMVPLPLRPSARPRANTPVAGPTPTSARSSSRPDIDAVMVCTPDHWHALPAIAAARAGKDVFVEKPLTYSIAEGRALSDAVRRHGRVLQVGSQQRSDSRFRLACELVRNGRIGRIERVEVGCGIDPGCGNAPTDARARGAGLRRLGRPRRLDALRRAARPSREGATGVPAGFGPTGSASA